ncbi:MAG: hypothetical protein ACOCW3_05185 [Spirochaetota bacterium]
MNKRLLIRAGVLAATTMFALGGCLILIGDGIGDGSVDWDLEDWTADLKIVGEWNEDSDDIELWTSYPRPEDIGTTENPTDNPTTNDYGVPEFEDPYYDLAESGGGDPGFFLADAEREMVQPSSNESTFTASGSPAIELKDYGSEGEQVILVNRPPWSYDGSALEPDFQDPDGEIGLPSSAEGYAWVGVGELYVHASSGNIPAADLEITIYDADDNPLISFRPPDDTSYASASVARIHYFIADRGTSYEPYYLIVPDQRWITNGTDGFRSVSGTTSGGETFVGAFGRAETE